MKEQLLFNGSERWTEARLVRADGTIVTFPKYLVSDQGRIMSIKGTPKILKAFPHGSSNEPGVALCTNCHAAHFRISRLVLSSFCSEQHTEGATVSHINKVLTDDRLCNLQWKPKPM